MYPLRVELGLVALVGIALGAVLGWGLRGRALLALEAERTAEHERIRTSVLPVLERRAAALSLSRERHPEAPVERAVAVASAIQAAEEKLVLPFTDTLEISRTDLARATDGTGKIRD